MPLSLPSLLLAALFATLLTAAHSQPPTTAYPHCNRTFSCGNITNVIYPFTGGARPSHCGPPEFALACRNNTVTELTHDQLTYRVLQLHQTQRTLVLSRSDLYTNTCTSEFYNTTLNNTLFSSDGPQNENLTLFYGCDSAMKTRPLSHFSCYSEHFNYSDAYYMVGAVPMDPFFWESTNCSITINVPVPRAVGNQLMDLQLNLEEGLRQGFTVNYSVPGEGLCLNCSKLGGQCGFDSDSDQPVCVCGDRPCPFALALPTEEESKKRSSDLKMSVMKRVSFGLSFLLLSFLIIFYVTRKYRLHEQDIEINQNIEKFLLNHGSLTPNRYKYKDIKKITKSFTDKLGQGAYGIVYKGKLSDGQLIAVKVLTDTDDIAEDFVNEVASISRTSHVNIVNLLGFCYERKKRALIYEYMPNKSLDKFISKNRSLEWEKLYEIAVGVARGLEYLHRGCNTRIVHFDIKPQNILLDEDFRPKISDFGLAKLFKKKQSVMSTLGTRGTIGYIAPEVFSRNFGAASHKSDVYSYGMMLLEMAGAKRNVEIDSSENDFSDKIYERVILVENEILDDVMTDENEETGRKMLLIGVWCIQIAPSDRPSMSKVVEMLEGSLQSIQIPPKPFISSPVLSESQFSSSFSTKFGD